MFNKNSLTKIISTKVLFSSQLAGHKFGKIVPQKMAQQKLALQKK